MTVHSDPFPARLLGGPMPRKLQGTVYSSKSAKPLRPNTLLGWLACGLAMLVLLAIFFGGGVPLIEGLWYHNWAMFGIGGGIWATPVLLGIGVIKLSEREKR